MKNYVDKLITIQHRAWANGYLAGNIAWFVQVGFARYFQQIPIYQSADSVDILSYSVVIGIIYGFLVYNYWKSKIDQ